MATRSISDETLFSKDKRTPLKTKGTHFSYRSRPSTSTRSKSLCGRAACLPTTTKCNRRRSRSLTKQWPGESPLGRRFWVRHDEKFWREVVGVVADTKMDLDKPAESQLYVPYAQDQNWGSLSFVVRTKGEPAALGAAVREAVRSVDKGIVPYDMKTLNDVVSKAAAPWRVPMLLMSAFAGVAMLLAMLGIYGITSYYVTQRTHEIGVRMALGAQIGDVLRLVLRRAMWLSVVGVGIGLAGAFVVMRYLTSLLYGVRPFDAITFAGVALGLIVVALVAAVLPARRATKVDPLVALRYE